MFEELFRQAGDHGLQSSRRDVVGFHEDAAESGGYPANEAMLKPNKYATLPDMVEHVECNASCQDTVTLVKRYEDSLEAFLDDWTGDGLFFWRCKKHMVSQSES